VSPRTLNKDAKRACSVSFTTTMTTAEQKKKTGKARRSQESADVLASAWSAKSALKKYVDEAIDNEMASETTRPIFAATKERMNPVWCVRTAAEKQHEEREACGGACGVRGRS
jgi:hypothetical protein